MIGSLAVDDLLSEAGFQVAAHQVDELAAVAALPHMLDGAADRRRVTSNLATHLVQLAALLASRVRAGTAGAVPHVGIASHHSHHLIAASPDPDRRMRFLDRFGRGDGVFEVVVTTFKGGALVCPERDHRVQRLTKAPDSMVEALDSVHLVFGLRPGGADAELQPSA